MNIDKPLRRESVLSRPLEDEWILYDTENGSVHIINTTAELIWSLCDGSHTLNDMIDRMRNAYEVPDETALKKDIEQILQSFFEKGILVQHEG